MTEIVRLEVNENVSLHCVEVIAMGTAMSKEDEKEGAALLLQTEETEKKLGFFFSQEDLVLLRDLANKVIIELEMRK
jgi:hypothetical protein